MVLEVQEEYLVWEHLVVLIEELHLTSTKIIQMEMQALAVQEVYRKTQQLETDLEECKEVMEITNLEDTVD
jgi:hypothetical protein